MGIGGGADRREESRCSARILYPVGMGSEREERAHWVVCYTAGDETGD